MAQGGGADGGFAGATLTVLFRARIPILLLLALLAPGAVAWPRPHPPLGSEIQALIALAILAAVIYLHSRHAGLAALSLIAPAPGFLAAGLLLPQDNDILSLWLAYLPGFFLAGFLAAEIARRAAEGASGLAAARQTLGNLAPAMLCALAAACAPALLQATGPSLAAMSVGAGLCALIAVPLAASLLPFGENFAMRANRLRERRERGLAYLVPATQPRWGWSLSGITVVFVVLGFFGAAPPGDRPSVALCAAVLVAVAAVFLATRDWRRSLAALLAFLPALFLALWVLARMQHDAAAWRYFVQALGIAVIPVVLVSARAARFARGGEEVAVASTRALEQDGAAVLFIAAAAALSHTAFARLQDFPAAVAILLGGSSALVLTPAFAAALESVFPRRAVIEARYRLG
jgi:hypothetical protein